MVSLTHARLALGERVLWDDLDLVVRAGEFIAVLGPNGTGKTSLLKVLLGQMQLTNGTVAVAGRQVTAGSESIGYVPQHRSLDNGLSLRGSDLVALGYDGHRWGMTGWGRKSRNAKRDAVRQALAQVNGAHLSHVPVGVMSGGELQRVRVAQALATDPILLLCDEPLLNLDPANARLVCALIDRRRQDANTAVLFVTHEVDPVLPYVDRVLYLVDGRFRIGTVEEVMTSETLSALYRSDIEVVKIGGRYIVVGEQRQHHHHHAGGVDGHFHG
ncbi:ABC transporter ATP-binding protein [Mycolicibacterium cyprinidarum]|uniref:ABC transporter ATP-binding protein n=1 Tax=Mycolicibacterium cyprinidarum TaxID=2860311 RepID=A0ABQ4V579_9MYCO|nr:ABC transporter ATP-binding protein [Mycolicibacterium sp. NGTWSNA01]GJF15170.1 ABC transporter ATP-binding protein [Mycolicibacterium sp. NGTWS0302]GJF15386.1 ABC transporter ATP-binding protein [Mycolicibacterium sp. NGTWS1803]